MKQFFSPLLYRRVFAATLPVLIGYLTMGIAAGILLSATMPHLPGTTFLWAFLTSGGAISGTQQFLLTGWIRTLTPILDIVFLSLVVNLRYAMYGLSLIEKFKGIPWYQKFYLIWSLTDESYALEVAGCASEKEPIHYCLLVGLFDHLYWILGVTSGVLIGSALPFSTRGIDFAMTALFLVVLTDQCRSRENRLPAIIGGASTLVVFLFLPAGKILIPSMAVMIVLLLALRKKLETAEVKK